jgi:hypothetical protein
MLLHPGHKLFILILPWRQKHKTKVPDLIHNKSVTCTDHSFSDFGGNKSEILVFFSAFFERDIWHYNSTQFSSRFASLF